MIDLEPSTCPKGVFNAFHKAVTKKILGKSVCLVFSYFFAHKLTKPFVRALAARVIDLPAATKTIVYTNPVGPTASWMPNVGIHDWYREFAACLDHKPRIGDMSYRYEATRNLREPVSRSGHCSFEVWKL